MIKIFKKINLLVILIFAISCETKKIKLPPTHPYLYNLELKFKEDKINDYIVDSFFASNSEDGDKLVHCDVTLLDLLKALPIKKISVTDFANALADVGLLQDDDDLGWLITNLNYADLNVAGFSAEKLYKNIAKTYFKDRPEDLLQSLNILGIAEEFSVAYTFGSDEDIFNAFQSGNYSYHNLAEIANLIGGPSTLKELFSALGLKKFNDFATSVIGNHQELIQRGLTKENLKLLLESLGLAVSNYKESKVFKACYNSLTKEKSLAVAVSQDKIITNDDEILIKYLNLEPYTTLVAKSFQGGLAYDISADGVERNEADNIIHLKVKGALSNFIDQVDLNEDSSSSLCEYVTVYYDQLVVQNAKPSFIADQLTIPKLYNTPFKKGSPLVCGGKLKGLASINKFNSIVFDYVQNHQKEAVAPPTVNKPEVIDAIVEYFKNKYPNFNICKFLHCGENKDEKESNGNNENVSDDETSKESTSNASDEDESTSEEVASVTEGSGADGDLNTSAEDHTEAEQEQGTEHENALNTESSSEENAVDNKNPTSEQSDGTEHPEDANDEGSVEAVSEVASQEDSNVTPDISNQSDSAEHTKDANDEGSVEAISEVTSQENSNVTPDISNDGTAEPESFTEVLEDTSSDASEINSAAENAQPSESDEQAKTSEEVNELEGIVP